MHTRLPDRAVHVFFLRQFAKEKAPSGNGCLGDIKTCQVVKELVQPATAKSKTNFIDCMLQGNLQKCSLSWCVNGTLADVAGTPRAVGPTTYFVSHAWSYTFSGLIALIEMHYASLPDTDKGKAFVPVFYWVDILAVTQHFTGNFTEHPDSDFPGVIRASKAVLFTMYPWRAPIAPTRVWCLFEALTAVESQGVELEVLLDNTASKDTGVQTVLTVAASVDVRAAQATVASDKAFIMGRIRDGIGVEAFNSVLRKRLREALMSAALEKSTNNVDSANLVHLLKGGGGRDPDGTLDVPRMLQHGTKENLVTLLEGLTSATMPRRLILSGAVPGGLRKISSYAIEWIAAWSYLPLSGKALSAVGRLLRGQYGGSGGASGVSGGSIGGSNSSNSTTTTRRSGPGSSVGGSRGATAAAGGSSSGNVRPGAVSRRSISSVAPSRSDSGGGGGGGSGGGSPLQELWLCPAPAYSTWASHRPAWAPVGYETPEEHRLHGAVDPNWHRKEAEFKKANPGQDYGMWMKEFNKCNDEWKQSVVAKMQAAAEAREKAGRAARLKEELKLRAELWAGLAINASLTVLGLQGGELAAMDVDGLALALRQQPCLKEMHIVNVEPEENFPGGAPALYRGLLAAGLGSRTLERLTLTPASAILVSELEVPAVAAWDLGGGAALQELVLSPVALRPRAVQQLAELLAHLPLLRAGCIDVHKAPPRLVLPGTNYKKSPEFSPAVRVPKYAPFTSGEFVSDLQPMLQLRETISRGATPSSATAAGAAARGGSSSKVVSNEFVSALTHFLAVNTDPAEMSGAAPAATTATGESKEERDRRLLLQQTLEAAAPEYRNTLSSLLPRSRTSTSRPPGSAATGSDGSPSLRPSSSSLSWRRSGLGSSGDGGGGTGGGWDLGGRFQQMPSRRGFGGDSSSDDEL